MARYRFELADQNDEAELRRVTSSTPTPGRVSVAFHREPNFFVANHVLGPNHQTVVCRDTEQNEIVGLGIRSVRKMYVNGEPTNVGYLSGLRSLKRVRSGGLLARGYRYLKQLHVDATDPFQSDDYITTIAEGNQSALSVLTSGRAGLPRYRSLTDYHTLAIAPHRRFRRQPASQLDISSASESELPQLIEFMNEHGKGHQYFPVYRADDFVGPQATFRDLAWKQVIVARRGQKIMGVIGLWDQSAFRQMSVVGYQGWLHTVRPAYNLMAQMTGKPQMPRPGDAIRQAYISFPVMRGADTDVFDALLEHACRQTDQQGFDHMLVGLADNDPLLPAARRASCWRYTTHVYRVAWDADESKVSLQTNRTVYLELGCL